MQTGLRIHEGRVQRAIHAIVRYEPRILRGLTWSHFGYVAVLAIAFGAARAIQDTAPAEMIAWMWTPLHWTCGLCVLLCATVLTNMELHRIPRAVVLAIAVVAGCAAGFQLYIWLWRRHPVALGNAINLLRVVVLQWGLVAAAYYYIERSARRAAELREAELERRRIETQVLEARLQVMQAQVEPHFLFNTLAHVQRLYQTDPARGRTMLDSFCGYLRAAMPHFRGNASTLDREVDVTRAYLDTQKIRMGRRLRFQLVIPDALRAAAFPPMILLSLVENAVKHGLNPLREGGSIRIVASSDNGVMRIIVADTGAGFDPAEYASGDGVGLSNIRSRLAALYRNRARLMLRGNAPHGVVATIELPMIIHRDGITEDASEQSAQIAAGSRRLASAG